MLLEWSEDNIHEAIIIESSDKCFIVIKETKVIF